MAIFDEASNLWINSASRAIAFLLAMSLVLMTLYTFECQGVLYVFRNAELTKVKSKGEWDRLPFMVAKAGAMDADLVVLLGGSTSRELSPSDQLMSRELSKKCGKPIRFLNAGSSSQNLSESWAIADALPRERLVLVAVGLNVQRLLHGPAETRRTFNGFRMPFGGAPDLRAVLSRRGMAPGYTFPPLRMTGWILKRRANLVWSASKSSDQFAVSGDRRDYQTDRNRYVRPILSLQQKQGKVSRMIAEGLPIYDRVHAKSTDLWVEFVRNFSAPHRTVLFLDLPVSETLKLGTKLASVEYNADIKSLLAAGARVEPVHGGNFLVEDDFYDQQHIVESGRRKIAESLVSQFASAIRGCEIGQE